MRIQHNIAALNAYRNLTNNNSSVSKNLEKLSSGYRINRAGDDAAGLAISEKMRAQITGLQTAQKNANDGVSLVQTAEGALTEVHSMLNRMVELATQSANGTYDNDTDRAQLQKELKQLVEEIDRIADSSNFNGIKLLDGSLESGGGGTVTNGIDRIIPDVLGAADDPITNTGVKTILDGGDGGSKATKFDVDFTGLTATKGDDTAAGAGTKAVYKADNVTAATLTAASNKISVGGVDIDTTTNNDIDKVLTALQGSALNTNWTIAKNGDDITFTAKTPGAVTALAGATETTEGKAAVSASGTTTVAAADESNASFAGLSGIDLSTTTNGTGTDFSWTAVKEASGDYTITITSTATDPTADATVGGVALTGGSAATTAVYTLSGVSDKITAAGQASGTLTVGDFSATVTTTDLSDQLDEYVTQYNADASNLWTVAKNASNDGLVYTAKVGGAFGSAGAPTTAPTGTTQVTAGADGAAAVPGADSQITFKIGNATLATDVTVTAAAADNKATATEIASAVFNGLTDGDAATDGTQVSINGAKWTVTDGGNGKLTFELVDAPTASNIKGDFDWDVSMKDATGKFSGNHTAGTTVTQQGQVGAANAVANTVFEVKADDIKDGTTITVDGKTVTLAVGAKSNYTSAANVVDLTDMEEGSVNLDKALGKISEQYKSGTDNFIVGVNDKSNGDAKQGITVHRNDSTTKRYTTKEDLAAVFSIKTAATGKPLTLQIGDDSEEYNQLKVDIKDCHAISLGIDISQISIADQGSAATAVEKIKEAINKVSDVRGTLGATQNRLDHTINNLSVQTENITAAESRIRDVDMAEEMMAYTKNNILVQAAQAMLAQANQVPQGVLQLLQ